MSFYVCLCVHLKIKDIIYLKYLFFIYFQIHSKVKIRVESVCLPVKIIQSLKKAIPGENQNCTKSNSPLYLPFFPLKYVIQYK